MPRIYFRTSLLRQWVEEETLYASPHWEGNWIEYPHHIHPPPILYFVKNKRWILVTPDSLCGPDTKYKELTFNQAMAWLHENVWPRDPHSVPDVVYIKIKELENQEWANS